MPGMRSMQRPDPSKIVEDLFSKLDCKGRGYIEKSDLEAALGNIGNSNSKHASHSAEQMFSALDGDGKVAKQEMAATFEKIASELDGPFPRIRMLDQDIPPPPHQGFTQEQLTDRAQSTESGDGKMTGLFGQLAQNFDAADSNGDGKITRDEATAYRQANASEPSDGNQSGPSRSSSDRKLLKTMMDLLHAYGSLADSSENTGFSASA